MTSRTTWKNRAVRAAVALFAVAVFAAWLLFYSVVTALAKEYLPSPWDGIVQWGLLAVVVFLCFYFPTGSKTPRRERSPKVRTAPRQPTSNDRDPRGTLWWEVTDGNMILHAWKQTGPRWFPRWTKQDLWHMSGAPHVHMHDALDEATVRDLGHQWLKGLR